MVPLLWLADPLSPLVYEEPAELLPDDIAGLLYAGLSPDVSAGLAAWLPAVPAALWRVTVLLAADTSPEDFDAVTLLLRDVLPPTVPLPVLLLVLTPLLSVVLPVPVNTRSSFCVS